MDPSTDRHDRGGASRSTLALWALAFGGGAYLGYGIAYSLALSGLGQLGAVVAALIAAAILTTLTLIAVVSALLPDKRGRPAARVATFAGVLLALGIGSGWVVTSLLGLDHREPTLLEAQGTMNLSLEGITGYDSEGDALASCRSQSGAGTFPFVEADLVGTVDSRSVVASISIPPESPDGRPVVSVWIQAVDKTIGTTPVWRGPADIVARADGDRSGSVVFAGARLASSDGVAPAPAGWPPELSGTVSWSCGAWSLPG